MRLTAGSITVLILGALGTALCFGRRERKEQDQVGLTKPSDTPRVLLAAVIVGAIFAAIGAGVSINESSNNAAKDRADQATANRQTCLAIANSNWRQSIGLLLAGYTLNQEQLALVGPVLRTLEIEGVETPEDLQSAATPLLVQALLDDSRIASVTNPLCPFFPGNPERTPDTPQPLE